MRSNLCNRIVSLLLLGLIPTVPLTKSAIAAESVTLQVYDPGGSFEVTQTFAPRVNDLKGKTVCELSDGQWEDTRTFPLITELLQARFPTAKILPYTEFPHESSGSAEGGGFAIDLDTTADLVEQKGCQAVIVGNAG